MTVLGRLLKQSDNKIISIIHFALSILSAILFFIFSESFINTNIRFLISGIFLLACLAFHFLLKYELKTRIISYFLSILFSLFGGIQIYKKFWWNNYDASAIKKMLFKSSSIFMVFFFSCICLYLFDGLIKKLKSKAGNVRRGISLALYFSWFVFLFMPVNTMIQNQNDYMISLIQLGIGCVILFLILVTFLIVILGIIPKKINKLYEIVLMGLIINTYIQYMFMNNVLSTINGSTFDMAYNLLPVIINTATWLIVFVIVAIIYSKRKLDKMCAKINKYVPAFLFAIEFIALVTALISAPKSIFNIKDYNVDNSKQFYVASDENVIVFVLDAVDNNYIKELLEEEEEVFEGLEDFTLYTNTCSIYNKTNSSMTQMFSGSAFEEELYDYDEFYKRLHDDGYIINFYNYEYNSDNPISLEKYFDNYSLCEKGFNEAFAVDYQGIIGNISMLSTYQLCPDIMKTVIDANKIDFKNIISHGDGSSAAYSNDEYLEKLQVIKDTENEKYFIVQHVLGAHIPEDAMEGTRKGLEMVKRTIGEMKEQGIYDNATIIITADHGFQHETIPGTPVTAATPVFMIKRPNEFSDELQYSAAPIYHTDFLATILDCAKLYNYDEDKDRIGIPVYERKEDEKRERIWADSIEKSSRYRVYRYTGDTADLEYNVDNNIYDEY